MILCPNCLHKEMIGAYFCSECGAQLVFPDGVPTASIHPPSGGFSGSEKAKVKKTEKAAIPDLHPDEIIAFHILSSGETLTIRGEREVTLGRASEGQPIVPDIDLSPYHAYEAGVSRLHASIQIKGKEITVTDLGSANGTSVNEKRIASHLPHPIHHGDLLALGKFKIQVVIQ